MPRCNDRMPELTTASAASTAVVSQVRVDGNQLAFTSTIDSRLSIRQHPYARPLVCAAESVLRGFDENIGLGDEEYVPFVYARRILYGEQDGFVAMYETEWRGGSVGLVTTTAQSSIDPRPSQWDRSGPACPMSSLVTELSSDDSTRTEILAGIRVLGLLSVAGFARAQTLPVSSVAPTSERRWLKLADFAVRHDVSLSTVKHWRRLGLPTNGIEGRGVRVNVSEGDAWLAAGGPRLAIAAAGARHGRRGRQ